MNLTADDFDDVARDIQSFVIARSKLDSGAIGLIAIDGENGAGKSTFAARLAEVLGVAHIQLDTHLRQRSRPDEPFLDLVNLVAFEAAARSSQLAVVDGVLIADVLARANLSSDYSIYIKRISAYGYWHYGLDLVRGHLVDVPGAPASKLDEEILEYHLRRLPHECANLIFHLAG